MLSAVQMKQEELSEELDVTKKQVLEVKKDMKLCESKMNDRMKEHETKLQLELKLCESKMNDRMKEHETNLQLEMDTIRSDLTLLKTKHTETDTQIESMIEVKMIETAEQVEAKHLSELEKMRKEINESDLKMDSVLEIKMTETREEEWERTRRRTNDVIVFGIEESKEKESIDRINHDKDKMKEIMETLLLNNTSVQKITRLGKPRSMDEPGDVQEKHRPMKVVFDNEQTKNEILRTARNLNDTKYKKVYIVQDLTIKEREQRKVLIKEREEKKIQGQDWIIIQGKLVPRRTKKQE